MTTHSITLRSEVKIAIEVTLQNIEHAAEKQLRAELKESRYQDGSRANPINWNRGAVLRTALAIGYVVFAFYRKSCVASEKQTSDAHTAHRVSEAEFLRRIVRYVHMAYPKFTETYGHELDGANGEMASLSKKIYNMGLYAEFERTDVDPLKFAAVYSDAVRLVFLTTEYLRECSITPVTSNGDSRKPK